MCDASLTNQHEDFTICHECDLLVRLPGLQTAAPMRCPRCLSPIPGHLEQGLAKTLAAVLAGLLFFWPANFMPILQLNILGIESTHTMIGAVRVMAHGSMEPVAAMVLFCSVLAPLLEFILLGIVLVQTITGWHLFPSRALFRFYTRIGSWAMLEVYMIGLLISVIKIRSMASVVPGVGMFCFVGMMLANIAAKASLNHHEVWRRIEARCKR
ncbi:paraquat-inducible protein A [uncultured Desulfosarcina sp.]|uniref:paraquat-inducible protein A n=1 Tax=uncultured Desulfosarcina sp. TaxID=218289 RepID=UPI0029C95EE5|nr:paraquat-inducible protein A [uncultured Desulfosarcina sp.]